MTWTVFKLALSVMVLTTLGEARHYESFRKAPPLGANYQNTNSMSRTTMIDEKARQGQGMKSEEDKYELISTLPLRGNKCSTPRKRPLIELETSEEEVLTVEVALVFDSKDKPNVEASSTRHNRVEREATISRNELELNLQNEWTQNKGSHLSHIYLGESLYPLMYEESRVFQSETPKPSSRETFRMEEVMISEAGHKDTEVASFQISDSSPNHHENSKNQRGSKSRHRRF